MIIKRGVTRIVMVFNHIVIKIPNGLYSHLNFLNGCYANYSERQFCKSFKQHELFQKVAPSIFCTYFGLIQVQKRCEPLIRELTDDELNTFNEVRGGESKSENFGIYRGVVVCLDYP